MENVLGQDYTSEVQEKVKELLSGIKGLSLNQRIALEANILQSISTALSTPPEVYLPGNTVVAVNKCFKVAESKYGLGKDTVWKIIKMENRVVPLMDEGIIVGKETRVVVKVQSILAGLSLWLTYDQVKEILRDSMAAAGL